MLGLERVISLLGLTVMLDWGMVVMVVMVILSIVCGVEVILIGGDCTLVLSNGKSDTVTLSVSHCSPVYPSGQTHWAVLLSVIWHVPVTHGVGLQAVDSIL